MTADYIQIFPDDLRFAFELRKQVSSSLRFTNNTDQHVAYKVKTTSPKKYCVRPNSGVIPPNGVADVTVVMQSQKEVPADYVCKDKFLIQSVLVPNGTLKEGSEPALPQDLFSKEGGHYIQENKLKVVYIPPPQPPSPVAESAEEGIVSPTTANSTPPQQATREIDTKLKQELSFKEAPQYNNHVSPSAPPPAASTAVAPTKRSGSFTRIILVVLIAFLIGYFYGQAPSSPLRPASSTE